MGCTNSQNPYEEKGNQQQPKNEQHFFEAKLEHQFIELKNEENLPPMTLQKTFSNIKKSQFHSRISKKTLSYHSDSQQNSLKDMKFSQIQMSQIPGQLNTQSAFQTIGNAFYKTFQSEFNPFDRRSSIKESFIFPYNCIGMLFYCIQTSKQIKSREYFYFTAFLLSPTLIMTSANTLIPYKEQNLVMPLKFLIRQTENQSLKNIFSRARLVAKIMSPEPADSRNPMNLSNNFCLLELQSKIQREKYLSLGCQFKMQAEVEIFGYPMNNLILESDKGARQNLFGMKGPIKVNQFCVQYDIDTSPGQQGAPILFSPIQGEVFVIGIHSGYIQKMVEFEPNTNILDILEANSNFMKVDLKVNVGTHFTKKSLVQLKQWSKSLKLIEQIQYIDFQIFRPNVLFPLKENQQKNQHVTLKTQAEAAEDQSAVLPIVKYLEKAEKSYSNWEPHQSLKKCQKALQQLPQKNQYFQFKINFLFALNYQLLFQTQIALVYFNKCFKFVSKFRNKGVENILQQIDLFNNMSIIYLQKGDLSRAKRFLQKSQQLISANKLFSHHAFVGVLITDGVIEKELKNFAKALNIFESALKVFNVTNSKQRVIERQRIITILQNISQCHYSLKNLDKWALVGLQCLKKLQDIHIIQRIFQLQWFQTFLSLLSQSKKELSPECEFIVAKEISIIIQNCIEKKTEEFKKKLLTDLRLLKKQRIRNFHD